MESLWTWGFDVSNIGTKMSYSDNAKSDFIPTNLRIGTAMTNNIDNYNSITYTIDLNKLLVPTPPEYAYDAATGNQIVDANGDPKIHKGMDPNVAVLQGMVQSLYDAPGGYKEKLQEIMISVGAEYWYANQFALRGGYFNESENKGNRKYFTLGLGMKMNVFNIDFSYLLPTSGRNNPLANTMRFSLGFNFAKQKAAKKPAI
jgi:hypothetical protein